jgi:hypothetical protein
MRSSQALRRSASISAASASSKLLKIWATFSTSSMLARLSWRPAGSASALLHLLALVRCENGVKLCVDVLLQGLDFGALIVGEVEAIHHESGDYLA